MPDGLQRYTITSPSGGTTERELTPEQVDRIGASGKFTLSAADAGPVEAPTAAPEAPAVTPAPEPTPEPVGAPQQPAPERGMWSRAWEGMKGIPGRVAADYEQLTERPAEMFEEVMPEVRGIARGTTLNLGAKYGPQAQGYIAEGLESVLPVDEPGTPPREYASGGLRQEAEQAERADYEQQLEEHPIRTGAGFIAGAAPLAAYAAPYVTPAVGGGLVEGTLPAQFAKAAAGLGLLGAAETAHTEDPAQMVAAGGMSALVPSVLKKTGEVAGAAVPALRQAASRARLSAVTGQREHGAQMSKLARQKGEDKLTRMGEVVEESGISGTGMRPIYKTEAMRNADVARGEAGRAIGEIQMDLGQRGSRVDMGPTLEALRSEGNRLLRMAPRRAKQQGQELLDMADDLATGTRSRGRRPPTHAEAQKRADNIMNRATKDANDATEAGQQTGLSPDEIIAQTDEIFSRAQSRADDAMQMVDRPYETDYAKAHELRQWLDNEVWSNRTGDANATQYAESARSIASNLRRAIAETIEDEAPEVATPLRKANETYEAAEWIRQKGDAGGAGGLVKHVALATGAGAGMASGDLATGGLGYLGTMAAGKAAHRYGPATAAGGTRALQRGAKLMSEAAPGAWAPTGVGTAVGAGALTESSPYAAAGRAMSPQQAPQQPPGEDVAAQPMSSKEANAEIQRVMQYLEADPQMFGDADSEVRRAAESGNILQMRAIIKNARQQQGATQ